MAQQRQAYYPTFKGSVDREVAQSIRLAWDQIYRLKRQIQGLQSLPPAGGGAAVGPSFSTTISTTSIATQSQTDLATVRALTGIRAGDLALGAQDFTTDLVITSVDNNTISWVAGTIAYSDGVTTEPISATGSPKTLTDNTVNFVYKLVGETNPDLQFSTDYRDASNADRKLLGLVITTSNAGEKAAWVGGSDQNAGGPIFTSATAEIGTLSALTVNAGELTAGTLTGLTVQTADSSTNPRVQMDSTNGFEALDSNGYTRVQISTTGDLIKFRDASNNEVGSIYGYPTNTLVIAPPSDNTKDFSVGYSGVKYNTAWLLASQYVQIWAHDGTSGDETGFVMRGDASNEAVTGKVNGSIFMWNGGGNTYFYDSIVPSGAQDLGLTGTRWNALWVGGITSGLITLATGDIIPSGAGDSGTFIGNDANYFNRVHTHRVNLKELGEPGTPITGTAWLYLDSADGDLKIKFDSGNIATIQAVV
jgi:hypothetical protein